VIGMAFQDEIDLEEYIRNMLPAKYKFGFNVSVTKSHHKGRYYHDNYDTETNNNTEEEQAIHLEWEKERQDFISFKTDIDQFKLKELKFMSAAGMTREVASQLDFAQRIELEKIFPQLTEFNILAFKRKSNQTCRRALIYPQEYSYRKFIDCMIAFLNKHDSQRIDQLNSRVKIRFKGKSALQMDDYTFRYFKDKIEAIIAKYKLFYRVKVMIKKRVIEIEGAHEKVQDMRNCVKEVIALLSPRPYPLATHHDFGKFNCFGIKSNAGSEYISRLNNKFQMKAYGRYDQRTNRFMIRGDQTNKALFIQKLEIWIQQFNVKVKITSFEVKNPRAYFKNRLKAKEQAEKFDTLIQYNPDKKTLTIYYHEYISEDNRLASATEVTKSKQRDIENLKRIFNSLFSPSENYGDMSMSTAGRLSRDYKGGTI
jgi:hypothetical protein